MAKVTVKIEVDEAKLNELGIFCNQQGMTMNIEYILPFQPTVSPEKKQDMKPDTSRRIGFAKGKFHVPDNFAEWDKEVEELFEDGDVL